MAIVGVDQAFKELTEEELAPYVEAVSVYGGLFQETGYAFPRMSRFTSTVYSNA